MLQNATGNSDFLTPLLFFSDLQKLSFKLNSRKIR